MIYVNVVLLSLNQEGSQKVIKLRRLFCQINGSMLKLASRGHFLVFYLFLIKILCDYIDFTFTRQFQVTHPSKHTRDALL